MGTPTKSSWSAFLDSSAWRSLRRSTSTQLTVARDRRRVWLVDDSERNRTAFYDEQKHTFDVETFSTPGELLTALSTRTPDALLCDLYFYDDPVERERIEDRVRERVAQLRDDATSIGADTSMRGIRLISDIDKQFHSAPPFPIYAYTSKGPYLLQTDGFHRLEELKARWLFKDQLDPAHVRHRLQSDIREFRDQHDWRKAIWQVAIRVGLIGAVAGVTLDRLLRYVFGW